LTGIIVPVVKFRMDQSRFEQQKKFEAELARQAEIAKARAQFRRDLVAPVWQDGIQPVALRRIPPLAKDFGLAPAEGR